MQSHLSTDKRVHDILKGGKALFQRALFFQRMPLHARVCNFTYSVPINLAPGLPSPSLPWFFPFTLTLTSHSAFLLFPFREKDLGSHLGIRMGEE